MSRLTHIALVCLLSQGLAGQVGLPADTITYLGIYDTAFVMGGPYGELLLRHTMKPKQTLYSLAKFYSLSLEELYLYNPEAREGGVRPEQYVLVPMPNRAIVRYKDAKFKDSEHIPVIYVVRPGETMYHIATQMFKISVEEMMARNALETHTLRTGQYLHIGWIHVGGVKESARQFSGGPLAQRNQALRQWFIQESSCHKVKESQGVAFWKKDNKSDGDLYALHRDAAIHSVVAITNPMNKQTVYAKVMGRIPETAYGPDILVVVSPLVAKLLGARDPRFFVRVQHLSAPSR